MPRVNHVKRAQQRYATKPVIDPATGEQKVTPVINRRTGEQKVTKHGRPVVLRVTERDLERPLPMPRCDYAGCKHDDREIAVGSPYKWIEPSGQSMRFRHADCPTWNVWEYSSSLSARIAQIQNETADDVESAEDGQAWAEARAEEIRDLAEEKRESANNIVDGFGHETEQSYELESQADELDGWADEVETVSLPDPPECDSCEGEGCDACEEEHQEWLDEIRQLLNDALEACPV